MFIVKTHSNKQYQWNDEHLILHTCCSIINTTNFLNELIDSVFSLLIITYNLEKKNTWKSKIKIIETKVINTCSSARPINWILALALLISSSISEISEGRVSNWDAISSGRSERCLTPKTRWTSSCDCFARLFASLAERSAASFSF